MVFQEFYAVRLNCTLSLSKVRKIWGDDNLFLIPRIVLLCLISLSTCLRTQRDGTAASNLNQATLKRGWNVFSDDGSPMPDAAALPFQACYSVQAIVRRSTGREVIFLGYGLNLSSCSSNGFDKFFLV
ncbi:hypothetical protein Sjap_005578 [Stephania japonica]|uniref:Uncharacterized protein n=1 Tax=Stephania japonica TaxID=461633 RepID=A0AAP0PL96_9MAGN